MFRIKANQSIYNLLYIRNYEKYNYRNVQSVEMAYKIFEGRDKDKNLYPLIIMHGLFGSKQNWRGISRSLAEKTNRKIITVDARNHGDSPHTDEHTSEHMVADMVHLMKDLNISKASLMGHSMGGRTMMHLALKYPEFVEKAIIVDISPLAVPRDFSAMEEIFRAMKELKIDSNLSMSSGRQFAEVTLKKALNTPDTVDFILLNLRKKENGPFYWTHNVTALHNNFPLFSKFHEDIKGLKPFEGPIVFICGNLSNFVDPNSWPEIQKIFPNAQIHWLEAGHLVHLDEPTKFIEIVSRFLGNKQ